MKTKIYNKFLQIVVCIVISLIQIFSVELNIQRNHYFQVTNNSKEFCNRTNNELDTKIVLNAKDEVVKILDNISHKTKLTNFINSSLENLFSEIRTIAILCNQPFLSSYLLEQSELILRAPPFTF
ncbi:hypothetical protein [Rosettibacter firmus]|uniref:hypothetical protein n=1 Tax=Rosettibacter firmus TaxID=3111522 RepID=UPI00336BDFF4